MKRTCHGCGARFYDLRRDPIVCPICETVYDPERLPRVRRGSAALRDEPVLKPPAVEKDVVGEAADEDDLTVGESADLEELEESNEEAADEDTLGTDDEELIEDTSDLGEDDDDIGEVMEHVDDDSEDKA
jgi:uncharacterized protein (TIGR02300 family)